MVKLHPLEAAAGLVADRVFGEPPVRPHPVSVFGRCMRFVERTIYADTRAQGTVHAATGIFLGVASGTVGRSTTVATYLAVAGQALGEAASDVAAALNAGD